jgi:hypothetical protein
MIRITLIFFLKFVLFIQSFFTDIGWGIAARWTFKCTFVQSADNDFPSMRVLFAVEYASISVIGCVGSNECEIFQ